ncbi:SDR family oxidoreductase [Luteibacter aegosomatissinici]|uniref:SDR family oxidoreductase n=1 Tax=Luteibacter aegosomatissinici TaxID=2911539 RepID=UPI001FF8DA05|nr:SDR family oxidoreductase [Luteibacter aegosomatissinici]UPG94344.1 SDR family oxidoreductase [Luteibacter aegosomatissinici]
MRIFLTGATGFIGSRIVPQLLAAGHQVLGMTRSESGAAWLRANGADAHRATLEDLDSIRAGAAKADAIIHTAFDHDFSNFVANCEKDRRVIAALGSVLKGSKRPLLITSGTGLGQASHGALATEDVANFEHPNPRVASELEGKVQLDAGVNVSVVRLPQVHDTKKQGLITPFIEISREKGLVGYLGDGGNRWPAAHVDDVALLYRLAVERAEAGARYNAVAEEGVPVREIAEVLGVGLGLPVKSLTPDEAQAHFGWLGMFAGLDLSASSKLTRERLNWHPVGPLLLDDLRNMDYATATA